MWSLRAPFQCVQEKWVHQKPSHESTKFLSFVQNQLYLSSSPTFSIVCLCFWHICKVLSTAPHMPFTSYLQASFGPLNSITAYPGNASVVLLGSLSPFPYPIHLFFAFQFSRVFPVQPYCRPCYGCLAFSFFCKIRMNFSCELKSLSSKADPLSWTHLPFKSVSHVGCFLTISWMTQILFASRTCDRNISSRCLKKTSSTASISLAVL